MSIESTYRIEGMSCAACVVSVDSIISKVDDVEHVRVNLALEKAVVQWKEGSNQDDDAIEQAVNTVQATEGEIADFGTAISAKENELVEGGKAYEGERADFEAADKELADLAQRFDALFATRLASADFAREGDSMRARHDALLLEPESGL